MVRSRRVGSVHADIFCAIDVHVCVGKAVIFAGQSWLSEERNTEAV